jgi:hypothetical protein
VSSLTCYPSESHEQIVPKQLKINITTEKLVELNEDDQEKIALLDIMEAMTRILIVDIRTEVKSNESEIASYRKAAIILDLIFKKSSIDLME